jgi:hypothetical protein
MAATFAFKYTGGASNANPNLSLGGVGSSVTVIATPILNNLFDNVLPSQIVAANYIDYRAIDILNTGDATALHVQFFLSDTPNTESKIEAGYDATTQSIATEETAPSGITFLPHLSDNKLVLSNLAAGARHRIWIRRTITAGATNINNDTGGLFLWYS